MRLIEYEVHDFNPENLKLLQLREQDKDREIFLPAAAHYGALGPAAELWHEGHLYGCGGLVIHAPGSGELWFFGDARIQRSPISALVSIKAWIDAQWDYLRLDRLQARCRTDWKAANHFMRMLGFQLEATMRKFAFGYDYCLWARVR